jgi:hypothetical protein
MSKRQKVSEVCWFTSLPWETSLDDCIRSLLDAQRELRGGVYSHFTVEIRNDDYETGLAIVGYRDETDAEFKQRLKQQSEDKSAKKLKKQFEKEKV